jgi:hypothetical protein
MRCVHGTNVSRVVLRTSCNTNAPPDRLRRQANEAAAAPLARPLAFRATQFSNRAVQQFSSSAVQQFSSPTSVAEHQRSASAIQHQPFNVSRSALAAQRQPFSISCSEPAVQCQQFSVNSSSASAAAQRQQFSVSGSASTAAATSPTNLSQIHHRLAASSTRTFCMKASATASETATASPNHRLTTRTTRQRRRMKNCQAEPALQTSTRRQTTANTRQGVDCTCTPQPVPTCITHVTHALTSTNTHHRHRLRPQPPTAPTTRKKNRRKLLLAEHDMTQQRYPPTLPTNIHRQNNQLPQHFQVQRPHNFPPLSAMV